MEKAKKEEEEEKKSSTLHSMSSNHIQHSRVILIGSG